MNQPISVESILKGDPDTIDHIYRSYQPDFVSFCRKQFGLDHDEAREIFQDSVVTLYENVINGRVTDMKSTIKTYLFAIGKYKSLEFLRRMGRQEKYTAGLATTEADLIEPDSIESDSELLRRQRLMKECVRELGQACQEILTLYYFQQLSMVQICEKLQYKNEETVKSQKFKCMQQLRKNFMQKYPGPL